jgi:hypothetical protein
MKEETFLLKKLHGEMKHLKINTPFFLCFEKSILKEKGLVICLINYSFD